MRARKGILFDLVTGSCVQDTPLRQEERDTAQVVAATHEDNLRILKKRQEETEDPAIQEAIHNS